MSFIVCFSCSFLFVFKALRICGVYGVVNLYNGTAFKIDGCKEHKHQQMPWIALDRVESTPQSVGTVFNHDNGKGAMSSL